MCKCEKIGRGVQLFRIKDPSKLFVEVEDIGPDRKHYMAARKVWQCRECNQLYAFMSILYKDEEQILVRPPDFEWRDWDWAKLGEIADGVRWRGPNVDEKYII